MSAVFIINPAAGAGRAGATWDSYKDDALARLPGSKVLLTRRPRHGGELALEAVSAGATTLVAVGGDGTFSEVLDGVMGASPEARAGVSLACLPAGSGCDLARHLAYPKDREGLLTLLTTNHRRTVDVGRIRYRGLDGSPRERHFINIAAFGVAGDVAHHIQSMGKSLGGTLSYLVSSVWVLATAKAKTLKMTADGRDLSGKYHLGVLANTSTMGGGMVIAPGAVDDDGSFDLVLVGDMSRPRLLSNFPKIYKGTHIGVDGVSRLTVKTLEAASDEPVFLNIDGEADGMLPATFELLPKAVSVLIP